ncbi:PDZ and LIM domain protein 2 isoform X2 [Tenrec ecaudatus]|uniref:PDZ and LIM domain protein 2 isoform X2 n=1 Tax=Tenrec ecaudatus TaxID=94439 RepID=UPI003F59EA31
MWAGHGTPAPREGSGEGRAPLAGRPQPIEGSREHSRRGATQVAALWPGCAEEAASQARGGGRGGPRITWAEAGPGAPGELSPESRRAQRRRRQDRPRLFARPPSRPSRAWQPSPTGMALLTVDVVGPAPWGFRITGGRDFHTPIMVTKVTERGKAEAADLRPGDIIVAINGESAEGMLHAEAQSKIRQSRSPLRLQLDRSRAVSPGQNGESSLELLATRFQGSVRTQSQSSLRSSYSSPTSFSSQPGSPFTTPPPSSPSAFPREAAVSDRSFQNQTQAPGLAADGFSYGGPAASRQAGQGRAGDSAVWVLPPSQGAQSSRLSADAEAGSCLLEEDSEVFKMLQENREGRGAPRQSSSFRFLQEALEAEERGGPPAILPSSLSPQTSAPTGRALATPPKLHTCEKCSRSISNQAVRIQEGRYRHPGCYTCADCDLNLKMRGHFWVGDELYCEKHARQRYLAPSALHPQA